MAFRFPLLLALPCFAVSLSTANAEEALIPGGLSSDGKLEVVATRNSNEGNATYVLRLNGSKAKVLDVSGPGYAMTPATAAYADDNYANSRVLWRNDSRAFAFNLRGTKRTRSCQVFVLENKKWREVSLKNVWPQIFKDLQVKESNRCAFCDPVKWGEKQALVLKFSGDCIFPKIPAGQSGRWFEYEAHYNLAHPDRCRITQTELRDHNG